MTKLYDEAHYHELYSRLVPASGQCETLEGELLRAVSRIYYDYTNNGFGNNWSGALVFLDTYLGTTREERRRLEPYSRGEICKDATFDENDPIIRVLEAMTAKVIAYIDSRRMDYQPNPCDMFDLQQRGACIS